MGPRFVALVCCAIAGASLSCSSPADPPLVAPGKTAELSLPPDFVQRTYAAVSKLIEIPREVRDVMTSLCGDCTFAEPGQPWNSGDKPADPSLPQRQIVSAGVSGTRWFIQYVHSGVGVHEHVAVFDLVSDRAAYAGGGSGLRGDSPSKLKLCEPSSELTRACEW